MAWMAWRLPISWVPSVPLPVVFLSMHTSVLASTVFEERDPGNPYVGFIRGKLNEGVTGLCRGFTSWGGLIADDVEIFLPCDAIQVTNRHTMLCIWLASHVLAFWGGFLMWLRDELADRKAFLIETRQDLRQRIRLESVVPMVAHILGMQLFAFYILLLFDD